MANNEEKLVKMLKYVSEHNDFYKNRIIKYGITNPLDISQWPILTRKELQENRYNMFSDGYKTKYFNQQLRRQSSSGSTGMPVNVYWDNNDCFASNMCLWRKRWDWYGIKPSEKYCVFTLSAVGQTSDGEVPYYINKPKNILSFNVSLIRNELGYERMAEIINKFCPNWLYIQPFVLNQLIRAYIKLGIEPVKTIKYIESVGEILSSDIRSRGEELFHIKITNMYGSEEMNGIAIENPKGEMKILSDNVFLEIKNSNDISIQGEGEAIITNLNNYAMPLIRYRQGDCIYVANDTLERISGRTFEIHNETGIMLLDQRLSEIISETNNKYSYKIKSFHIEVNDKHKIIDCAILVEPISWRTEVVNDLRTRMKNKIENVYGYHILIDEAKK